MQTSNDKIVMMTPARKYSLNVSRMPNLSACSAAIKLAMGSIEKSDVRSQIGNDLMSDI